jgi:hypothetical protein
MLSRTLVRENPGVNPDEFLNRKTGMESLRKKAREEMRGFLEDSLARLVRLESRANGGGKPTISLFCRIDFSLLQRDDGDFNYFINEIDRTHTCNFWSAKGNAHLVGMLADEFAPHFAAWISELV